MCGHIRCLRHKSGFESECIESPYYNGSHIGRVGNKESFRIALKAAILKKRYMGNRTGTGYCEVLH
jgi:hypothetical protein